MCEVHICMYCCNTTKWLFYNVYFCKSVFESKYWKFLILKSSWPWADLDNLTRSVYFRLFLGILFAYFVLGSTLLYHLRKRAEKDENIINFLSNFTHRARNSYATCYVAHEYIIQFFDSRSHLRGMCINLVGVKDYNFIGNHAPLTL